MVKRNKGFRLSFSDIVGKKKFKLVSEDMRCDNEMLEFEHLLKSCLEDEVSKEILKKIYDTPGLSTRAVARAIVVSKTTVWERIKQMEDAGIIKIVERKPRLHACYLPSNVKEVLKSEFHPEKLEKVLREMEVVVSAPCVHYLLGFWRNGCAIALPINLRTYVGIREKSDQEDKPPGGYDLVFQVYVLPDSGLSLDVYEKSDLVYGSYMLDKAIQRIKELTERLSIKSRLENFRRKASIKSVVVYEAPPKIGLGASSALSIALSVALTKFLEEHDYLKGHILTTNRGGLAEEEKRYAFHVAIGPRLVTTLRTHMGEYKEAIQDIRRHTSLTSLFVSTFGTPYDHGNIFFRNKSNGTPPKMTSFNVEGDNLPILTVDTGGEPGVRPPAERGNQFQGYAPIDNDVFNALSKIAIKGREYIKEKRLDSLGKLISMTHNLVASLGEVSESTDRLARLLDRNGAYGARAVGYGKEGAVIALYPEDEKDNLKSLIEKPARILLDEVSLNVPGVRIE